LAAGGGWDAGVAWVLVWLPGWGFTVPACGPARVGRVITRGFCGLRPGLPVLPGRGGRYAAARAGRAAAWRSRRVRARMALSMLCTAAHRWISVVTMSPR